MKIGCFDSFKRRTKIRFFSFRRRSNGQYVVQTRLKCRANDTKEVFLHYFAFIFTCLLRMSNKDATFTLSNKRSTTGSEK